MVIIYTHLIEFESPTRHAKFQDHIGLGSRKMFLKVSNIYGHGGHLDDQL